MMYAKLRLLVGAGLLLAVAGVTTVAQEQDEPQPQQQPQAEQQPGQQDQQAIRRGDPQPDRTEQLWKQVGEIHSRIVAIEVVQAAAPGRARQTDRPGEQPGTRPGDDANRQPPQGQRDLQGQRDRGPQRGEAETSRTEQLWLQIGRLHKQIVALEAAQMTRQGALERRGATAEPGQSAQANQQQAGQQQPGQQQAGQRQAGQQPGQQSAQPSELVAGQNPQLQQLWQQMARLQAQIVSMEVKDAAELTRTSAPRESQRQ
jgi:hypothetical protein